MSTNGDVLIEAISLDSQRRHKNMFSRHNDNFSIHKFKTLYLST